MVQIKDLSNFRWGVMDPGNFLSGTISADFWKSGDIGWSNQTGEKVFLDPKDGWLIFRSEPIPGTGYWGWDEDDGYVWLCQYRYWTEPFKDEGREFLLIGCSVAEGESCHANQKG